MRKEGSEEAFNFLSPEVGKERSVRESTRREN
jgi:hypothetical protein